MATLVGADEVINAVSVNIGVVSIVGIAPAAVEQLIGGCEECTVSNGWSGEVVGADVAHHVIGLGVIGIPPPVGVSGDAASAPASTVPDGAIE